MSTESITDRVLRDVLNSDTLAPYCGDDAFVNAKRWRFLEASLAVLEERGMLADPADYRAPADPSLLEQDGDDDGRKAAPLDPSKVTVEITDWEDFRPGDVVVQNPDADRVEGAAFLVERHQPAPEPEPLVEGRLYEVTAPDGRRGRAFYKPIDGIRANHPWVSEDETRYRSDAVTDVRPLVVIDPAAGWWAEIHNALVAAGIGDAGSAATIALATLGIEATS